MLETSFTLNLGQLLKIVHELKKYLRRKMKSNKPYIVYKIVTKKTITFVVSEVAIVTITIDNHMVVIHVHSGKNIIDDHK
jgi:hypothetical protein